MKVHDGSLLFMKHGKMSPESCERLFRSVYWGYEFRVVAITASSVVDLGTDQTHSDTSMCIVIQ